jgi:hypothetical protein
MDRNRLATVVAAGAVAFLSVLGAEAQQPEMTAEQKAEMEAYRKAGTPGAPHQAMAATVGTYDAKVKSWHEPGGPPMEETGTATRSMALDGRVLVEDFKGSMMGMPFTGRGMRGYDNVTGKYWSTWMDSMSTGIMLSEGTCDAKNACTFKGSWNDPVKKAPVTSRMTSRWTSPTTEVFEMHGPGRDGKEMKMMEITYTKK